MKSKERTPGTWVLDYHNPPKKSYIMNDGGDVITDINPAIISTGDIALILAAPRLFLTLEMAFKALQVAAVHRGYASKDEILARIMIKEVLEEVAAGHRNVILNKD